MADPKIKYYPVGNGDTSLIVLQDNTTIIIDCNITNDASDENKEERYNVKNDLLKELQKREGVSYVDAFILTHPDNDHCRGIRKHFYLGAPEKYTKRDEENKLIKMDEIWFSPRIFIGYKKEMTEDALAFRNEAERRIELHKTNDPQKNDPGNRVKIIGESDVIDFEDVDHLLVVPGTSIQYINREYKDHFAFFVHAPFYEEVDDGILNDTSIVLQAIFHVDSTARAGLAIFGGDAGYEIWDKILTLRNKADLEWDLFLAPHHCSWTYFNETSEEGKKKPHPAPIKMLEHRREGNFIIASCKLILDDDDDPPHHLAKEQYLKYVPKTINFMVTSEYPDQKSPKPIVFRFTAAGPQHLPSSSSDKASNSGIITSGINRPATYGK